MRTQRPTKSAEQTAYGLLFLVCLGHFLNDGIQSVIPAALPILRDAHGLTFTQVGLITLVIQVTSSLLQPLVGLTTDKHPTKYMLELRSSLRIFESQNEYGYKPCIKRRFQNAETLQSRNQKNSS